MSLGLNSPERRYELVERIAVGGMAEVFRAKAYGPHGFEKVLAIKRILPGLAQDPSFERRFITEAKVAVSLSHANIVQVFDFSRFGQSLYIVMELVDGCDLSRALQWTRERSTVMPLEAAMHVAVEFLKGLEFAHKRGVVHRDLSPSNILLSRNGEVKIADFGIAQMGGSDLVTRTVKIMGKWRYMSPEQARGQELDARSDVFSAGVVLFELFTGQRLFNGQDADEIVHNLNTMPLPRVSEVRTDLPPELDDALLAALERDRDHRRMTAAGLLEAILEVCYTLSIPALPTSLARYIDEVTDGEPSGERSVSPGLLDEIIVSEIGAAPRRARGGERRTAMALSPPPMHPDDLPPEEAGLLPAPAMPGGRLEPTHVTMIRSVADPEGMRRWVLEDAANTVSGRPPTRPPSGQVMVRMPSVVTPVPYDSSRAIPAPASYEPTPIVPPIGAPRRGRALVVVVGGFVILAIIVTAVVRRARHTEAAEPVEVETDEAELDDPVAAAPPTAPAPVPVQPAAVANAAPPPAAAPDAAPAEPDRERPRPDSEAPSGRPRFGTIDIYSDPWADIYLGQKKVGTAPQRGIKLPYGKHRLRLVNPVQNRSTTVTVTVPASRPVRVNIP
jgi:eukaryotic-like serine/threonine-protein kinase